MVVGLGVKLYFDLSQSIEKTYQSVERTSERRTKAVDFDKKDLFSILLMGIDTGDFGCVEQGRSVTMMVATVSPLDKKTTVLSIPRDTYVDIIGHGSKDKIDHAYAFGGVKMAIETVQKYLDIPIDHYVSINMKELVDAVGGIEANNALTFTQDGYDFSIGKIELDGVQALAYSRMRYDDPTGDYGRQKRQREIVEGIIKKVISFHGSTHFQSVLNTLETNMKTDMSRLS